MEPFRGGGLSLGGELAAVLAPLLDDPSLASSSSKDEDWYED